MTQTAETREKTFQNGKKFIDHISSIDDLYTTVMKDIAKSSFEGAKWKIDQQTKFKVDVTYVLKSASATETPKWLISKFDKSPGVVPPIGSVELRSLFLIPEEKKESNLQYAWDGDDQLAYIDGVASTVFLQ
jgi:hypothetical protein